MKDIFELIMNGNLKEIEQLFAEEKISSLRNLRNPNDRTPLMCAIEQNQPNIFDFLLAKAQPIDVNDADGAPNKVLSYAAGQDRYFMDKLFGQFGVELDKKSLAIALGYYTRLGDVTKVAACLDFKADVNDGGYDDPPLVIAVQAKQEKVLDVLLAQSTLDINKYNRFKESAFITAIMFSEQAVIDKFLGRRDVDILQNSYIFSTALTAAVFREKFSLAETLINIEIEKQGDFDVARHPGLIGWVIKQKQHGLLQKILSLQKNIASINELPELPESRIQDGLAREEIDYPAVVNSYQPGSDLFELPSVLAVKCGDKESIRLLMQAGVDFAQQNTFGLSASDYDHSLLIMQAQEAQDKILFKQLCTLLKDGNFELFAKQFAKLTDKNIQDEDGMTLLHYALVMPNTQAFLTLLAAEQDPNIRNKQNNTALLHALEYPYCWYDNIRAFCEADKQIDLDLTLQNNEGNNALHLAIIKKHISVLHFLQTHENDHKVPQGKVSDGKTAEQLADKQELTLKLLEWPHTSDMQIAQITELFEENLFLHLIELNDKARAWCAALINNPAADYEFSIVRLESPALVLNNTKLNAIKILFSLLKEKTESPYYAAAVTQMAKIGSFNEQDILLYYQSLAVNFAKTLEQNIAEEVKQLDIAGKIQEGLQSIANKTAEQLVKKPPLGVFIDQLSESTKKMQSVGNERNIYYQLLTRAKLYQQDNNAELAKKDIETIYTLYTRLMQTTKNRMQKLSYTQNCLEYYPKNKDVLISYATLVIELNNKKLFPKALERIERYVNQASFQDRDATINQLLQQLKFKQTKNLAPPVFQLGGPAVRSNFN